MKKLISLLLVVCLSFSLFIPVSAASSLETGEGLIDLLSIAEQSSFLHDPHSTSFLWSVTVPFSFYRYVDAVVYSNVTITSAYSFYSGNSLTVKHIGDNFYRVYGDVVNGGTTFDIGFNFNNVCTTLNIVSCKVSSVPRSHYSLGGSWNGYTSGGTFLSGTFDGVNDSVIYQDVAGSGSYANYTYDYSLAFYPGITDEWKKYDKVSLRFSFTGLYINSISAICNGLDILESVSFLDNGTYSDLRVNINGQYYFEASNDVRFVDVVLDLSNIQKNIDDYPMIRITGTYEPSSGSNQPLFVLGFCEGMILNSSNLDVTWYKKIWNSITDGFTTLVNKVELLRTNLFSLFASLQTNLSTWITDLGNYLGGLLTTLNNNLVSGFTNLGNKLNQLISGSDQDNSNANDFNNEVGNQSSELDEMTSVMDSVDQPDISDVNLSVNGMVNPSVITLATTGISNALGNEIILRVLLIAFTFSMVGFILYGKKG